MLKECQWQDLVNEMVSGVGFQILEMASSQDLIESGKSSTVVFSPWLKAHC
jgi:hypothetical protein